MLADETTLTKQEIRWIKERRITRLTDNKEVQIYPMGAERYIWASLHETQKDRYPIQADITDKHVLIIPGHGNSSFLFALAGAKTVTVYDKDPVTIAWMKAYKKYYHYREYNSEDYAYPSIGELLTALTSWYPPLISLPRGKFKNSLLWAVAPNSLRRIYVHYLVFLTNQAIQSKKKDCFELEKDIKFYKGTVADLDKTQCIDTAFVPYLLGVKNGIEKEKEIVDFIKQLMKIVPDGRILVSPSQAIKEFHLVGKRYLETIKYHCIQDIPELVDYVIKEDKNWFRNQGMVVFGME